MTISADYFKHTNETVGQACIRLKKEGVTIKYAAQRIGYYTASDLRKYLQRHGIKCPWEKK